MLWMGVQQVRNLQTDYVLLIEWLSYCGSMVHYWNARKMQVMPISSLLEIPSTYSYVQYAKRLHSMVSDF